MKKVFNIKPENILFYELISKKSEAINYLLEKAKNDEEFIEKFFTPSNIRVLKNSNIIGNKSNMKKEKQISLNENNNKNNNNKDNDKTNFENKDDSSSVNIKW